MKRLPACVALTLCVAAALPSAALPSAASPSTASARWASPGDWGSWGWGPRFVYPGYYAVHPEYGGCWRWSRYPPPRRVNICY